MPAPLLFVGDPHAEPHSLKDCAALGKLVLDKAQEHQATVVLVGDLYHTHNIIHADVQYFWWCFFAAAKERGINVIVLKGNHDAPSTAGTRATALIAHIHQCVTVLYEPKVLGGVLFCPYAPGEQLVEWSQAHPEAKTLFCHQTFNGSVYENGFFAGDGVDPHAIAQEHIISGHIHAPQEFGKVWYPGAPRWRTLSDANTERAIWLLEVEGGVVTKRTPIDTGTVCRKIFHLEDTPATPITITNPDPRHEYRIDSKGPQLWLETRKPVFEGWALWRPFRTDQKDLVKVKESEGVGVAFGKWLDAFQPKFGTKRDQLDKMVKERFNGF
jgi:DNA repair exonuclease SbcCD nuclease subunit